MAYMPHFAEACINGPVWQDICEAVGVQYIDPTDPVDTVLNAILRCRHLLTEAMHGAIVADAYRVPWTAVCTHKEINDFKWTDWSMSMGLEHKPLRIWRPLYRLSGGNVVRRLGAATTYVQFKRAVANAVPQLSADRVVADRQERLLEMLGRCKLAHPRASR